MSNNIATFGRRVIDPAILSVLDVTADGKVVSAEDWTTLWSLVIEHVNSVAEYCTTLEELQINWDASAAELKQIVSEFRVKYAALAESFVHYGTEAPTNPNIRFWVQPVEPKYLITVDQVYDPTSPRPQSGVALSQALSQLNRITTVTLNANAWVGSASPYSQVINISGITTNSKVDLNPTIDQLNTFHTKDITFIAVNNNGVITVYCIGQKPTMSYTIQATITEVTRHG